MVDIQNGGLARYTLTKTRASNTLTIFTVEKALNYSAFSEILLDTSTTAYLTNSQKIENKTL